MICIKHNDIKLEFDEQKGEVSALLYGERNFADKKISVFEISMMNKSGKSRRISVSDFSLGKVSKSDSHFECRYENNDMAVVISARIDVQISWNIKVENKTENVVEWVDFPQILVEDSFKDNGGNSKLLWGFNEGMLIDDMQVREDSFWKYLEPAYPGEGRMGIFPAIVETQFMAYYDDDSGLYFAAHDSKDNLKGIDFYRQNGGVKLQFRHYTGAEFGADYEMPYEMVMKAFVGDWHDASEIYKVWFEKNHKEDFIPITQNDKLPSWYGESPVIVTYPVRGRFDTDEMSPNKLFPYCNAMEHIKRLEKVFDSRIMVILMHWEGTAPWAPPVVWPPYGGEEELQKFIDALHERNDIFGVYCSGMGWTLESNLVDDYDMREEFKKEGLADVMCLSPEQELLLSHICTEQRSGYDMCPTQEYTKEILKDQVKKMTSAGIDYIQLLDQNHGGTSYFCYARNHGHAPVPGKWQVDAVSEILKDATQENVLFGCESAAAESYIPQLLFNDNRYNLCYAFGKPVPAYAYIYHKYLNNFMGNQVCTHNILDHKRSPENFCMRVAHSFCAGDMLTVVINQDGKFIFNWGYPDLEDLPNQENIEELIKNLNYWRKGIGKKYLHTGEMVKPYTVECEKNTIFGSDGYDREFEKIFTSAWKDNNGSFGQFFVNYTDKDVHCVVDLPEGKYRLYQNDTDFVEINGGKTEITIKKLSAILIEK